MLSPNYDVVVWLSCKTFLCVCVCWVTILRYNKYFMVLLLLGEFSNSDIVQDLERLLHLEAGQNVASFGKCSS